MVQQNTGLHNDTYIILLNPKPLRRGFNAFQEVIASSLQKELMVQQKTRLHSENNIILLNPKPLGRGLTLSKGYPPYTTEQGV